MAHVPLVPIGKARREFLDDRSYGEHQKAVAAREDVLASRRREVHGGWGAPGEPKHPLAVLDGYWEEAKRLERK